MNYTVPAGTRIGHVHLKVSDIDKALSFYKDLLGFQIKAKYGAQAVFLAADNYHHHIGLNTWYSKNAQPAPAHAAGLFHTAILYSTRKELAAIFKRLLDANYPFTGFADHGVSEALYLNDPDENGVELYWDKPHDQWPFETNGNIDMYTHELDVESLLSELDNR